jgi:hypothetical protein
MQRTIPILVFVAAMAALYLMAPARPRHSGFSFELKGGDCVVWYSRDEDRILDLLIAPRAVFRDCYDAARGRLRTGEQEVAFGTTQTAYIFDAGRWRTAPFKNRREADLPGVADLANCASTGEVARKILGE